MQLSSWARHGRISPWGYCRKQLGKRLLSDYVMKSPDLGHAAPGAWLEWGRRWS